MISLINVSKSFGVRTIFDRIFASFNPSVRTALVGPNGAGKTLLLRAIAGQETIDSGEIVVPNAVRIGFLPQELDIAAHRTPLQYVLLPFAHLLDHDAAMDELFHQGVFGDEKQARRALEEYDRLMAARRLHHADSLESRARSILHGLGIANDAMDADMARLSGGFRMRVVLAQLLLMEPDFLLLDEPTNHLDLDSLVWLEKFMQKFRGGMLVVSHDWDFLIRCTTHTAELERGTLTLYKGTIDAYFAWKAERDAANERRAKSIEAQIAQTERFIERFKAKNTKAAQAKSKQKQLERLREQLPGERVEVRSVKFCLPSATRCGTVPIKLDAVTASYGGPAVFENLTVTVARGEKVALIGPNGAGKSTLLKVCAGELAPIAGTVVIGRNTEIRYYSQHRLEQLNPQRTAYETIADVTGSGDRNHIMSILGAFFFSGEDVYKTVGVLSGGEKSRLSLATILARPGNVLLLDEPTNHLDIHAVDALGEMLAEFDGTILVVSHDERFISRFSTRLLEVRPKVVRDFPGTPAQYRSYLEAGYLQPVEVEAPRCEERTAAESGISKEERNRRRDERTKLERRIEKLEAAIHTTEQEIKQAQAFLDDPANASNYEFLAEKSVVIETMRQECADLVAQWERAQEDLAAMALHEDAARPPLRAQL